MSAHNFLIVAGDFNARIGADYNLTSPNTVGKHTYHDITNNNGFKLTTLCEMLQLIPIQSKVEQPKNRIWTWTHPKGNLAQIDHILVRAKWVNSVRNCRSYSTIALDSDHRIVTADFPSLRRQKKSNTIKKNNNYDWKQLATNHTLQDAYAIEIQNKYDLLCKNGNIQNKYDSFIQIVTSANKSLPKKTHPQ